MLFFSGFCVPFVILPYAEADMVAQKPASQPGTSAVSTQNDNDILTEQQPAGSYRLDGFRSAHFGMTPQAVLAAITTDLGIEAEKVVKTQTPQNKSPVLITRTKDLIPGSGEVVIAYGFAVETPKLNRVTLIWGAPVEPALKTQHLLHIASALQRHFILQGYEEEERVVNGVMPDGSFIAFRGKDQQGRGTLLQLILPGTIEDARDTPDMVGGTLKLSYLLNPDNPSAFSLPEGSF